MSTEIIAAFNAAYAAAQAECENPALDGTNPAFKSKFSTLAATRNAVVPVFARHGIAIQQAVRTEIVAERLFAGVETVLRHADGHSESLGVCLLPVQKADAQGIASCVTYAKRQTLQALAGVTGEQDDDAESAVDRSAKGIDPRPVSVSSVDPARVAKVVDKIKALKDEDIPGDHDDAERCRRIFAVDVKMSEDADLACAVMDALAAQKIYTKAEWRAAVAAGRKTSGAVRAA